jgi:hypothetical protein
MALEAALENTVKAASNRAAEGKKLFGPIASFLDKHLPMSANFSPHLLSAEEKSCFRVRGYGKSVSPMEICPYDKQ